VHYLIKKPRTEVQQDNKRRVEFLRRKQVKAAIESHLAMIGQNLTDGYLHCRNGTATIRSQEMQ
jgi:hypothetical protein